MDATDAEKKLAGGVAVITGAGSGIGSGFARRAGKLGMTVIVTDISAESAEAVAQSIRDEGGSAESMRVDVSKPSELDSLADHIFSKHGSVRLLINNAGIETLGFTWEIPPEKWEATLNINIHGVIHGVRAFAPRMLESGQECWIGNLASVGGFSVMPSQTAYIVTKHAVEAFSECLFLEMKLKEAPIHVCSVIPGMLKTSIFNANADDSSSASKYRRVMHDLMSNYGMDLDEGCKYMLSQIAEGKFWVSSQPEMTKDTLARRIEFLKSQSDPAIADAAKPLLGI